MAIKCICLIGAIILMMIDNPEPPEKYDDKYGKVSFREGYWWHFEDGDDDITVNGAAWSGKERVYINDQLMSEQRNLTFSSTHEFHHNGANYTVYFKSLSKLTAEMECSILKNNREIGKKAISFFDGSPKEVRRRLWPVVGAGFVVGLFAGTAGFAFGKKVATGGAFELDPNVAIVVAVIGTLVLIVGYFLSNKS